MLAVDWEIDEEVAVSNSDWVFVINDKLLLVVSFNKWFDLNLEFIIWFKLDDSTIGDEIVWVEIGVEIEAVVEIVAFETAVGVEIKSSIFFCSWFFFDARLLSFLLVVLTDACFLKKDRLFY